MGALYRFVSAIPAQICAGAGLAITAWSAGNPSGFQYAWGWAMTPEHIRIGGLIGLAIFLLYWVLLWWLRPRETAMPIDKDGRVVSNLNLSGATFRAGGDLYQNVGTNNGHMGPVHHHHGKKPFALTNEFVDAAVVRIGTGPIKLRLVGERSELKAIGDQFATALANRGVMLSTIIRSNSHSVAFSSGRALQKPLDVIDLSGVMLGIEWIFDPS